MMGSPENEKDRCYDESPPHRVTINYALAVGKYPVTFAEWDAYAAAVKSVYSPNSRGWASSNHPVRNVSWDDVQGYMQWLKKMTGQPYRLLSEAEWEYVCRAGTSTRYSFGDNEAELGNYAWYSANSGDKTHPVGQKRPNAFGLYDLHGNVWEWVEDCYQDSYHVAPTDGAVVERNNYAMRVLRGGSSTDNSRYLRSANRNSTAQDNRLRFSGFRIAKTLP